MTKKAISCIVILSLLGYLSCSQTVQITKDEFNDGYIKDEDKRKIYITTKDSSRYSFPENSYKVQNDTIYGEGKIIDMQSNEIPFYGKIALGDIESFEGTEQDTALLITLIVFGIAFVGFIISVILAGDITGMGGWGD